MVVVSEELLVHVVARSHAESPVVLNLVAEVEVHLGDKDAVTGARKSLGGWKYEEISGNRK